MTISRNKKLYKWKRSKRLQIAWLKNYTKEGPRFYLDVIAARALK